MAKPSQSAIRKSLEKQLQDKGANVAHFQDLLDDYLFLCSQLRKLEKEAKRGQTIKATSASGKEYDKDNPALKLVPQYAQRKTQLLQALGLTTDNCRPADNEGGDL